MFPHPTYDTIVYSVGGYSLITTSFGYGGLNPNWTKSSKPPTSTCSESFAKSTKPSKQTNKPKSTVAHTMPYHLDDKMIVDDGLVSPLKAKWMPHGLPSPV